MSTQEFRKIMGIFKEAEADRNYLYNKINWLISKIKEKDDYKEGCYEH